MRAMAETVTGPVWPAGSIVVDLDQIEPFAPSDLALLESRDSVSIGAVSGRCVGPALAAAVAVDLLVVGPEATFGRPELWTDVVIRRGVGISGRKVMAYLAMTGRLIDAATALRWGLANLISADPVEEAQRLADEIGRRSPVAVAAIVAQARQGAAADYLRAGVEEISGRMADRL